LVTGELPFRGNKAMLLHQVLHDEPLRPRALNDKVPRDLETIALKAMAKEPTRRYASAKGMPDDLRRWLGSEPILARPVRGLARVQPQAGLGDGKRGGARGPRHVHRGLFRSQLIARK